jgi:hypothetical protein
MLTNHWEIAREYWHTFRNFDTTDGAVFEHPHKQAKERRYQHRIRRNSDIATRPQHPSWQDDRQILDHYNVFSAVGINPK